MTRSSAHRIGVVIFDGVKLLDVAGPMEVFAEANRVGGTAYELVTLSLTGGPVTSSTGLAIGGDASLDAPAAAAVSPRHLSRLFRAELGVSPARYVEAVRIDAGKRALERGLSVADASSAAGFGTPESMRRAFVTRLGVSPRTYQQRFRSSVR